MTDFLTILSALDRLKLLPLPEGVLLPGSALQLTVFEPRYLELVTEALHGDHLLALAMLEPQGGRSVGAQPAVRPLACLGLIEEARSLPGERLEIVVRGVTRVRICGEHPAAASYREVIAQFPDELPPAGPQQAETVRRALLPLCATLPGTRRQAVSAAAASLEDPGNLCDVVAATVLDAPEALQGILESLDVGERLERLLAAIGSKLLSTRPPATLLS